MLHPRYQASSIILAALVELCSRVFPVTHQDLVGCQWCAATMIPMAMNYRKGTQRRQEKATRVS